MKQNPQWHNISGGRPFEESCFEGAAKGIREPGHGRLAKIHNILIINN
jgi:hypothetical protein